MVQLDPEAVERFKKLIKEEFGVEYSDKEAWEAAHNFYNLFHLLYKMDQKQNPENYKRESK